MVSEIVKTHRYVVIVKTCNPRWIGTFKEEPDKQEIEQAIFLDIADLEKFRLEKSEYAKNRVDELRSMLEVIRIADLRQPIVYVGGTWVGEIVIEEEGMFRRVPLLPACLVYDTPGGKLLPLADKYTQPGIWRGAKTPLADKDTTEEDTGQFGEQPDEYSDAAIAEHLTTDPQSGEKCPSEKIQTSEGEIILTESQRRNLASEHMRGGI